LDQFNEEISEGRMDDTLVTGILGSQMGSAFLNKRPRGILKLISKSITIKKDIVTETSIRKLAPTIVHNFNLILEAVDIINDYSSLQTDILLLSGTDSSYYLRYSVGQLVTIIPHTNKIILEGV
jgi:hypothetical protein